VSSGHSASRVPDATLTAIGVFVQGELRPATATGLTAGLRYQRAGAATLPAAGSGQAPLAHDDDALVGALSLLQRLHPRVNLVAAAARGFRSPNLIERFYSGPTPEGRAVRVPNPELTAETSLSFDVGLRLRTDALSVEAFAFRTTVHDAITVVPTGREVDGRREYRNENVAELGLRGVELSAAAGAGPLAATLSHARLRARGTDADAAAATPRGRTAAVLRASPGHVAGWVEYGVRHTPARTLSAGATVGRLPGFTVHDATLGVTPFAGQQLAIELHNVGNRLYAEPANFDFLRPAPGRSVSIRWRAVF
jgi:outer membrane receptor protein involved in Fe transport